MPTTIILIGPMGAGKTTIGKILASSSSRKFKDTDQIIEERTGADIPWIFDVEGEDGFRDREQALLRELLSSGLDNTILATGGGIVERSANRELLKSTENVVYLNANLDQLIARTSKDKKRPLLNVENPSERVKELFYRRDPLYRDVADAIINTERRSPKAVADEILSSLD
ncbi:MAG: shikimate kinase [Cellvibrionaceae bacterium]